MYVIFNKGNRTDLVTVCNTSNQKEQSELMHRRDIDEQVREWQETNSGNPPRFYSRITIKEFTNRKLNFSNLK
jgi:hypothetical protein